MRKTRTCPKCEGREIWLIEQMKERGEAQPFERPIQPFNVVLKSTFWQLYKGEGFFQTYICKACGYTEWYALGIDELQPDSEQGVHLLVDRVDDAKGPYR